MSKETPENGPDPATKHTNTDEEPEHVTRSMLDVSLGRIREKILLQRFIVIARLPSGLTDRNKLAAHYEKLNLQLSKQFVHDYMTGLLLLYPSCLLHVIESSRDVLVAILKDLIELEQRSGRTSLEAPKIVYMAHNPCSRWFQQWSYKLLNVVVDQDDGAIQTDEEPIDVIVNEVLVSLKSVAKHLEQSKKADAGLSLNKFGISNILSKLLTREELQTPQQYMRLYNSPVYIRMDFGQVKRSSCLTTV